MERRYGRYVIVHSLGSGAMGDVFRARDERLGREVALKTVRNVAGLATDAFRSRFDAEARALAALSHPAIVAVHDLGIEGDEPYLVMELVDGPSLKGVLANGPLGADKARAMGIQLARALEAAHARGILHRDIKPANILRSSTGQWKLADFGIARVPDSDLTMTGQFLGTPAYSAPESIALGQFSDRSDVFALAVVIIEAITGTRVRDAVTITEIVQRGAHEVSMPATVPPELATALRAAVSRAPAERPTAAQLAERLASATAPATQLPTASLAPRRRIPMALIGVIAGGAIGIGVLAAVLASGGHADTPAATHPDAAARRRDAAPAPDAPARQLPPIVPGQIVVVYPQGIDRKAYQDYDKIAEKVRDEKYDDALEKLDDYERAHGSCPESKNLRQQIDATLRSE